MKADRVLRLYGSTKERHKGDSTAEFIQKYKKELRKEIDAAKDKSAYLELKAICQKNLTEDISMPISVCAVLISMAGMVCDNKIVSVVIALFCVLGMIVITAAERKFLGKLDKYRITDLILDEIYKEKFKK